MDAEQGETLIFTAEQIRRSILHIADSIVAEFQGPHCDDMAFIGIQQGGVELAVRIADEMERKTGIRPNVGTLDISMYRDDIGLRKSLPQIRETNIPFDINGKVIILTDDVLQTGRSIRAALDALTDFGRPAMIRLAALIDRGAREFPIRADYVGEIMVIPRTMHVLTKWGENAVYAIPKQDNNGIQS